MRFKPRRRLLVDSEIQGVLLVRIFGYWCASVMTISLITLALRAIQNPPARLVDYFAFGEVFRQHGIIIVVSAILVPLIMWDVLYVSNRFAGPVSRLRRSIRGLSKGETVKPIQFREKDYWKEVAQEFNDVVAYIEDLKRQLAEARAEARQPRDLQAISQN